MSFLNLTSDVFGLDIGDLSLKLVYLAKKNKKIELKTCGETAIPRGFLINGEIQKEKELAHLIKTFVKEGRVYTPYVVSVLPETKTFIKTIEVPRSEEQSIEEAIKKEIELYIPFKLEEVYFDWQIIDESGSKIKILIALAAKEIIESYTRTLKMAGLQPISLEIESSAILKAMFNEKEDINKTLAFIDLGATRSSLIIIDKGVIQLTISLPLSGDFLTQNISNNLKVDAEQAQKMKRSPDSFPEQAPLVHKEIESFAVNLASSIKDHLKFYEDSSGQKIEKIVACGGVANLSGLMTVLEKNLPLPIIRAVYNLACTQENALLPEDKSLIYTTALGLALVGLEESF
jgi:type IV pilus assembly protein PilM